MISKIMNMISKIMNMLSKFNLKGGEGGMGLIN